MESIEPLTLISPKREICGMSALPLPFDEDNQVDWAAFDALLDRTLEAGLIPAVNMDTGYVNLLDDATADEVLAHTQAATAGERYVAGVFVADNPGDAFDADQYFNRICAIQEAGGVPVIFQSYGLAHQPATEIIDNYERIATACDEFIAFELGQMFAPFGDIYSLDTYRQLMLIDKCTGTKHSSLRRDLEWRRLALRNEVRPDFKVYTGNDLAIDMVIYGSDYLLGLSSFAPDAFAPRDALGAAGDPAWNELNDQLQHLGFLAFRQPAPAYNHAAVMFLHARGWLTSPTTHPNSPRCGEADSELLTQLAGSLEAPLTALHQEVNV